MKKHIENTSNETPSISKTIENNKATKIVETIIFNVRWALIPFYFGLIIALFLYLYSYGIEIIHLINTGTTSPETMMFTILALVDVVMVANLVKMTVTMVVIIP